MPFMTFSTFVAAQRAMAVVAGVPARLSRQQGACELTHLLPRPTGYARVPRRGQWGPESSSPCAAHHSVESPCQRAPATRLSALARSSPPW